MKVLIKNKTCNFSPNYNPHKPSDNGWMKQNQDNFKICTIGGERVFVKRFEKETKYISGYKFLQRVKNKRLPFLPVTYDLVTIKEEGKNVTYLFQEVIKGKTLDEVIKDKNNAIFNFNSQRFTSNIYNALLAITREGFWYTDFVEKNIFVGNDGNCYLIDLDSVIRISVLPNKDTSQVNRNYQIAVFTYWYRDVLKYDYTYIGNNLKGDTLNFLQLFIFVAQVKYYIEQDCQVDFLSSDTRKAIPNFLLSKNETFTKAVFKSCFEPTKNHQQILNIELFNSYVKSVLFKKSKTIKIDFGKKKIVNGYNTKSTQEKSKIKNTSTDLQKAKIMVGNYEIFKAAKFIKHLSLKYPNDIEINKLSKDVKMQITKCEDYYIQANQCFKNNKYKDALRYINYIRGITNDYDEANDLKKRIKERDISYRAQIYLIKSEGNIPYECPNCKFPVKDEAYTLFNNSLFWGLPIVSAFIGFNLFSWIGLLSGLIGLVIWLILLSVLPSKWLLKEQSCDYCYSTYFKVSKKIEDE